MVNCPHACGVLIRQLFMGFKSPLENWNVWQKKSRTAEESLILREIVEWVPETRKSVLQLANILMFNFRYSAKIWGFYTQNFKISTLLIHFSLENLVEILGDCLKLCTLKYIFFHFCWGMQRGWVILSIVGSICNNWTKHGQLFATHSITIFNLRPFEDNLLVGYARLLE